MLEVQLLGGFSVLANGDQFPNLTTPRVQSLRADPREQLTNFNGGCNPACVDVQAMMHQPESQ